MRVRTQLKRSVLLFYFSAAAAAVLLFSTSLAAAAASFGCPVSVLPLQSQYLLSRASGTSFSKFRSFSKSSFFFSFITASVVSLREERKRGGREKTQLNKKKKNDSLQNKVRNRKFIIIIREEAGEVEE